MATVLRQKTLGGSVGYSGIGLHSGQRVGMTFLPAPPDTGIRFRRMDLDGKPEIRAHVDNVNRTTRATTLSNGNVRIHTVEHILATFAGCGVDNVIVELEANEPPIADGSARVYCDLVKQAGIVEQDRAREVLRVAEPVLIDGGESLLIVFPCESFRITCTSDDRDGRYTQHRSIEVTLESWERELAPARTFAFFEELETLSKNGLIQGGSLENSVIIREDAILTTEPLRYNDEFVRHKILDIIGDLALVGCPIQGHVVAIKPNHTINCRLARALHQSRTRANGTSQIRDSQAKLAASQPNQ